METDLHRMPRRVKTVRMFRARFLLLFLLALPVATPVRAQTAPPEAAPPWANKTLVPELRARMVIARMTTEEKLRLVKSSAEMPPDESFGLAGFVQGIAHLGIPPLRESNAELGVAMPILPGQNGPKDEATALPSGLATAASWDPKIAYANGAMIGAEARAKGFNVMLAGAANLARDPRTGRNFEYFGEDPLLSGILAGESIRGIQDQHVISTLKHFALNDQETNRTLLDAKIDMAAFRESDLLAFQIALERGNPGSIMCSYNLINGVHACENPLLLDEILRKQWRYRGWVMSDWGALHSTKDAAMAGLDQESGAEWDSQPFFGEPLTAAIAAGIVPASRLDEMVFRVLSTMFAHGLVDDAPTPAPLDVEAGARVAQQAAEAGIVLLRNKGSILPLSRNVRRIAVIGAHADVGVMSGGGSSQVLPIGGAAAEITIVEHGVPIPFPLIFDPSSPLRAIAAKAPQAKVTYSDGKNLTEVAALAKSSDIAIVFATRWEAEGHDAENLSLPNGQDKLIATVAAANPRSIVVLETGNPVLMPWLSKTAAVIEAWYPGARGGEAIANVLFGDINPSGHLPMTFPASAQQLPRAEVPGRVIEWNTNFRVDYSEGSDVGYRWYHARNLTPLFPFGFGLSYTSFRYGGVHLRGGKTIAADFSVTNTGKRTGAEVAQIYALVPLPKGGERKRLIGWGKVELAPGETKQVSITADPRLLGHFDEAAQGWRIDKGTYRVEIGDSAQDVRFSGSVKVVAGSLAP